MFAGCAAAASAQVEVGPQVRIDVAGGTFAANETTMAASDANPLEVTGAWNDWRRSGGGEVINMGVALTLDGGTTWSDFLVRPPSGNQSGVEGDPMTAADPRTGYLWVGAISFAGNGGVYVARKAPGAANFEASVMARATSGADKCWMAAGRAHDNPNATKVYIAYNEGLLISSDLGQTWGSPRSLGSGIGFLPRVGPNGEVYVAYWDFESGVLMKRSFDGGNSISGAIRIATRMDTWGTQDGSRFPGTFRVPPMNYLAVDPNDGTLYCVYFDTTSRSGNNYNVDLYFTKSTDRGDNWTTPRVINTDNTPPGDQFFPWLEVDSEGRLHMHFFDSRHTNQNDDNVHGMFDNYYAYSEDGGDSWLEFRLTPNSWDSDNDGLNRGSQFIGDYSGLAVAGDLVFPCYLSDQNGDSDTFTNVIEVGGEPQPGACCFDDGSCLDLFREDCATQGGLWHFRTDCGTYNCPQPGACCYDDGTCADILEMDCTAPGSSWSSGDCGSAQCAPPGACCVTDDDCQVLGPVACEAAGGDFNGHGSSCGNACPCDKVKRLKANCSLSGTVKVVVKFKDASYNGQRIRIAIGSAEFETGVLVDKAKLAAGPFSGSQTVRLVSPACNDTATATCP
ncbi:MAG: exo-alpha-sialidase [Phycisphaerales bacterium]|nr:exo-alpha-sialidase [Phycisphaerales bacterium]